MPNFTLITTIALCIGLWLTPSAQAQDNARNNHGSSPYPIWSELSYFERDTLSKLSRAENGDPDALLALYLVASNVRELAAFETVNRRIYALIEGLEGQILEEDNPHLAGEILNRQMHNAFFLAKSQGKAPSGYAVDQSRLMGIFETGEYNCISSALLYVVLARHFSLEVKGSLLPSHAFVELMTEEGALDVETTSATGFAKPHTAEFYANQNREWYEIRGLTPASYDDYLTRERVSPVVLGARNMLNQHTAKGQMAYADSMRLAEISAFIHPSHLSSQEKRLYFYNNEIHQLANSGHWESLARMMYVTYDQVLDDTERLGRPAALIDPLLYYQLGALKTYANIADSDHFLSVLASIMTTHPAIPTQRVAIEADLARSIGALGTALAQEGAYATALEAIEQAQSVAPIEADWGLMISSVYNIWVKAL